MAKNDARSLGPDAQEALRRKAVAAVCAGMYRVEAAKVFGVRRHAVGKSIKTFRERGEKALAAKTQGRPKGIARLKGFEAAAISVLIWDRIPEQLKQSFAETSVFGAWRVTFLNLKVSKLHRSVTQFVPYGLKNMVNMGNMGGVRRTR